MHEYVILNCRLTYAKGELFIITADGFLLVIQFMYEYSKPRC